MPVTALGKFKLFTRELNTMGTSLIISSHGSLVPDQGYKKTVTLRNANAFWFLAPPNSSIENEPYEDVMRKGSKMLPFLGAEMAHTEYPLAAMYTPNMSLPNMILTHFKGQREKESVLIERAVTNQELNIWNIMTVNKSAGTVTLEEALNALTGFCNGRGSYNFMIGFFCGVRPGYRDNREIYNAGYKLY